MKKYILVCLLLVMIANSTPVSAVQPAQLNAEAKAALIKELTLKLNELIISLNALLAGQDMRIKIEVSKSRANAELYYTLNQQRGYLGACTDIMARINSSLLATKSSMNLKSLDASCFDSKTKYALSMKTSKGYVCADSTGFSGEVWRGIVGTSCVTN